MKITPGPWKVYGGKSEYDFNSEVVTDEAGKGGLIIIAECAGYKHEANAKAIAAVPDMIEDLKAAHTSLRTFTGCDNWTTFDSDTLKSIEYILDKINA